MNIEIETTEANDETNVEESDVETKAMLEQLVAHEAEIAQFRAKTAEANAKTADCEARTVESKARIAEKSAQIASLREQIPVLEKEFEHASARAADAEVRLRILRVEQAFGDSISSEERALFMQLATESPRIFEQMIKHRQELRFGAKPVRGDAE